MKKQQGFVLVFTVVILIVAAILGLYAMRSTIMQDKMTANINNKTITTNVAEAGASEFKVWLQDYLKNHGWPNDEEQENFSQFGNLPRVKAHESLGLFGEENNENGYYWVDPDNTPSEPGCNSNPCWLKSDQLIILNVTGYLIKGEGNDRVILGESIYKVKIKAGSTFIEMPNLPAALTLAGDFDKFSTGNSAGFKIDGGPENVAIATDSNYSGSQTAVDTEFQKSSVKTENYKGSCAATPCTGSQDLGMWGNAEQVLKWVDSIKDNKSYVTYYGGGFSGKVDISKPIIIVDGDLTSTGNVGTFNGILIVLGNATFNGNFGTINGGVYIGNINRTTKEFSPDEPGKFNGGGTFEIKYDESNMTNPNDNKSLDDLSVVEWVDII